MLIKFLKHGKGGGKGPVNYVMSRDGREIVPELILGDPKVTMDLIDSLEFKHRYTSGVIAFHESDNPTRSDINEVIEFFEKNAFAGLENDQYNSLWVCHRDKGKVELHFIVPRVELATGKSLNIQPPGDERRYNEIRDYLNEKNGWVNPMDHRQELNLPDGICRSKSKKLRLGLKSEIEMRESIHEYIKQLILDQKISSRQDIIEVLNKTGLSVTRSGKNYLTVADETLKFRMKGGLYEEDNCTAEIAKILATGTIQSPEVDEKTIDHEKVKKLLKQIEETAQFRAQYFKKTYKVKSQLEIELPSESQRVDGLVNFNDRAKIVEIIPKLTYSDEVAIQIWVRQGINFLMKSFFYFVQKTWNLFEELPVARSLRVPQVEKTKTLNNEFGRF